MLKKLIEENKKTFSKFLLISAFATIIDYILLFTLTSVFNIYYLLSGTISYCIGIIINYTLNKKFNFKTRNKPILKEFTLFFTIYLIGLGLNNLILYFGVTYLSIDYLIAKIFSIVIIFFWNYFGNKYISFN